MKRKTVTIKLTLLQAEALSSVAGNGWGDGDFAEYMRKIGDDPRPCARAMEILDAEIHASRVAEQECTGTNSRTGDDHG